MDLQLKGKRALVTGSSIGIGETIARALAEEGVVVAIHGRDRSRAEAVAHTIRDQGGAAVVVTGDLTEDAAVGEIVRESERLLGGVDILSIMLVDRAKSTSGKTLPPMRGSPHSIATSWRRSG